MKQDGGAAFPVPPIMLDDGTAGVVPDEYYHGLTKRQWYKGMALQGLLSAYGNEDAISPDPFAALTQVAARYADAMLAEDAEREGKDG